MARSPARSFFLLVTGAILAPAALGAGDVAPAPAPVDFERDVRPILAENCLLCHGPDAAVRKGELRLDDRESPLRDRGGYAAIVPGDPSASRLLQRVTDAASPMPPSDVGRRLKDSQVEMLRRWIAQGASWSQHWAYVPPRRPAPPVVEDSAWPRNEIDRFVLARLEREGIAPAAATSQESLLRRATLDLTGVPPTIAELDSFLAAARVDEAQAYDREVERLLASPRHAERMALDWLDAARYGDTHGFHLDNERTIWRYRDWVIDAFAKNLPFDRFTIEQLAGDLLPDATLEQKIATGFLRCNPTTAEGGLIEEEYLVKYAVDRAETVSTVWLGSTLACAQCHDHKYDPFRQREFYEFYAFFNNIAERGTDENIPNPAPFLKAPTADQAARRDALDARVAEIVAAQDAPDPEIDASQARFDAEWLARLAEEWEAPSPVASSSRGGATLSLLEDRSLLVSGENPDRDVLVVEYESALESIAALKLDALRHESFTGGGTGRSDNSNFVLSELRVEAAPRDASAPFAAVPLVAAIADYSQPGFPVLDAIDGDRQSGWAVQYKPEDRVAHFAPAAPFGFAGGTRVRVTLECESAYARHVIGRFRVAFASDPSAAPVVPSPWRALGPFAAESHDAALDRDFGPESGAAAPAVDGVAAAWREIEGAREGRPIAFAGANSAVYLRRELGVAEARRVDLTLGSDDGVKVWLNGALVHESRAPRTLASDSDRVALELRKGANELLVKVANASGDFEFQCRVADERIHGLPAAVAAALSLPEAERTESAKRRVRELHRSLFSPAWRALDVERQELLRSRESLDAEVPTTLVAAEASMRRPAHFLIRGQYDRKGDAVQPDVPAALERLDPSAPRDRLALARWLVDRKNPLTARVVVNRLWQRFFGTGIVETLEDFGARGAPPSHPELLDWLAVELMDSGWDLRHVIRLIVGSATYRQSARASSSALERDPRNRLLARGPRHRLDAEAIRDSALFASGLLVEQLGGPSVKPYQPDGVWQAVAYPTSNTARYQRDRGDALYRRSLYTFWKRTAPPPALAALDAPSRESCCVQRPITNTPLQALALMNDVQFVEASRFLAERMIKEGGAGDDRLAFGFRLATSRRPSEAELSPLRRVRDAQLERFRKEPEAAAALLAIGEKPRDAALDAAEHAALTVVANLLLNLDESMNR